MSPKLLKVVNIACSWAIILLTLSLILWIMLLSPHSTLTFEQFIDRALGLLGLFGLLLFGLEYTQGRI